MRLKIRCTDKNCGVCNPRVVPIPLPPEPPHDRVVEAVDQDGQVRGRWTHSDAGNGGWLLSPPIAGFLWDFGAIVSEALDPKHAWSLRHVAAESGEQT